MHPQGSEIFTVFARDGDQGNPNPIHYSIVNGKKKKIDLNARDV